MRRQLVVGNWKMHGSRPANAELLAGLLAARPFSADVAVCVPFVFLSETAATLAGGDLRWGAQDVSAHEQGAYTGEVSATMLAELGCRYAIGAMKARGTGSIINMSSRSGLVGIPGAAAYASSKAAIRNHSKSVALWCASQGWAIRCNSIHPAAILTPMWEKMLGDGPDRARRMADMVADTPLKRFGTVEEVAAVAVMLASDEAGYVTGSEFSIDGGLLAGSAGSPG